MSAKASRYALMDDDALAVRREALGMVERYGRNAPEMLFEAAEIAASTGDLLSEEAWLDIAHEAERELRRRLEAARRLGWN